MEKLQNKYRRFREWEQQPHEVAPLSEEQHVCATCSTHYEGNYCPRCGQSCKIVRYSFKNAFLLCTLSQGLRYTFIIMPNMVPSDLKKPNIFGIALDFS